MLVMLYQRIAASSSFAIEKSMKNESAFFNPCLPGPMTATRYPMTRTRRLSLMIRNWMTFLSRLLPFQNRGFARK